MRLGKSMANPIMGLASAPIDLAATVEGFAAKKQNSPEEWDLPPPRTTPLD